MFEKFFQFFSDFSEFKKNWVGQTDGNTPLYILNISKKPDGSYLQLEIAQVCHYDGIHLDRIV